LTNAALAWGACRSAQRCRSRHRRPGARGGTHYSVWVGLGAVGTAILGMVLFGEPASAGRLASLGLIVAGIVGLKLATP